MVVPVLELRPGNRLNGQHVAGEQGSEGVQMTGLREPT